ncbi:MAG: ABC transporter permease, partial [Pseudomonadota bacterium]
MTEAVCSAPAAAPKGRSLWASAWLRLRRNKAAMVSLCVVVLYILAGIFGPMVWPHNYATVYPAYVKVPASLEAYPREDTIIPGAERALSRARLTIEDVDVDDGTVRVSVTSSREIDPRVTRYLDRSDLFSNARVAETGADGQSAVLEADVARLWFLFGTDANGRDLVSRIFVSIRISLMIAALA